MPSSKNAELHWRCRGLSIGFIALAGIKMSKNSRTLLICQDIGISLLEVWYDEKPEIVIPNRIQKIKEFVCLVSKSFDIQTISYKTLTPEYLDWYAKLTGLPSVLTNKICSNLYK